MIKPIIHDQTLKADFSGLRECCVTHQWSSLAKDCVESWALDYMLFPSFRGTVSIFQEFLTFRITARVRNPSMTTLLCFLISTHHVPSAWGAISVWSPLHRGMFTHLCADLRVMHVTHSMQEGKVISSCTSGQSFLLSVTKMNVL